MRKIGFVSAGVACVFGALTVISARPAAAGPTALQGNVVTNLSCAPSQNGTGHLICGEEMRLPSGGPIFGHVSWQASPTSTNRPTEPAFTTNLKTVSLATGPFTSTPGCASTNDGTGAVICAVEGPNNALYGIAVHPQPNISGDVQSPVATALMPLVGPGTQLNATTTVSGLAGSPSCAPTPLANQINCGVVDSNKQSWAFSVNGL